MVFNFCVSMHHYIWVYWDQLDANCLVLFYYTFFALHVSDVIHMCNACALYDAPEDGCVLHPKHVEQKKV
jgi:hypothetical protein